MVKTIIINGSPRAPNQIPNFTLRFFKNTIPVKQYLLT